MAPDSTSPSTVTDAAHPSHGHSKASAALIVGALGVVFGDIGTSPLYALRETFLHDTSLAPTPEHVLGVLSTLFWAVTLTVTIKYVTLIMRADNKGEGGVLALATLGTHGLNGKGRRIRVGITLLAVIGLALFYGDAIITPAITVLSAVEGLSAVAPAFEPYVVPLALVILVALFMLQARGTADVGRLFGPVMLVWFVVLGVLGAWQIAKNPAVLWAINPIYAVRPDRRPGARHLLGVRLDRAGRHRRRGALCRHGPFRPPADPHRMARRSSCRACCSTTSARAR